MPLSIFREEQERRGAGEQLLKKPTGTFQARADILELTEASAYGQVHIDLMAGS